jgi:hypothetical protein
VIITTQEIRPTTTSNFPTVTVVLDTQVCMAILVIFNSYKITPFHKKIKVYVDYRPIQNTFWTTMWFIGLIAFFWTTDSCGRWV